MGGNNQFDQSNLWLNFDAVHDPSTGGDIILSMGRNKPKIENSRQGGNSLIRWWTTRLFGVEVRVIG